MITFSVSRYHVYTATFFALCFTVFILYKGYFLVSDITRLDNIISDQTSQITSLQTEFTVKKAQSNADFTSLLNTCSFILPVYA